MERTDDSAGLRASQPAGTGALMVWVRKVRMLFHIARGVIVCATVFPWISWETRRRLIREWSLKLLSICGIRLDVRERAPMARGLSGTGGFMLIANHISWIDIYVLNAWYPVRFVAKSEIRAWPVIGWLCEKTGVLFIDRNKKRDALRMMQHLVERMQAGDVVCVFPEGTTSDGRGLLPFHANLMQAPVAAGVPVQPAGLRYVDAATGEWTGAPAYIDDITMWEAFESVLKSPPILARLTIGEPIVPAERTTRHELAELGSEAIRKLLD
jgi:1-acyl-sn-glycerol-3-phosphate acyltransferase